MLQRCWISSDAFGLIKNKRRHTKAHVNTSPPPPTSAGMTREAPPSAPEEEKAPRSSTHAASLQQPAEETPGEREVTDVRKAVALWRRLLRSLTPSSFMSKGPNQQETPKPARTSHRGASEVRVRKHRKLNSQTGKEAWKRWIQWRESQTNLYLVSCMFFSLNFSFCLSIFTKEILHFDTIGNKYLPITP